MNRQVLVAGVAVVALVCGLSACGGSDDKATSKPTKTATTPAVPVQPKGANGVTYDIQNWGDHANDPAVLAWKQTNEAIQASVNLSKILPAMRSGLSKPVLRQYVASLDQAKKNDWHVKPVENVKVLSATTTGTKAQLETCFWDPTTSFYDKNDKVVGTLDKELWARQNVKLETIDGRWVITSFKFDGKCTGGAPE